MKIILYHKIVIKQFKYKNKVWFFLHFFAFTSIIDYVLYVVNFFMKKVFIQIRQWVLKHRKKIIYGALALFIFQIWFFDLGWIWMENNVFAADEQTEDKFVKKLQEWDESLSFFKVVLYVLIYPILIVAWKLVDNSLVYWAIFWFDAILRNLRVIIRNIANFWLWWIFMYFIFKFLITGQKPEDMKKLLISTLIAWIWIQASWFIMAVLIDVSTVATYSIGWLPTKLLETPELINPESLQSWEKSVKNPYILKTTTLYDVEDDPKNIQIYMSTWSQLYISECKTFSVTSGTVQETLLLAPKYVHYNGGNTGVNTIKTMCNYDNNVYFFSNLYSEVATARDANSDCGWETYKENQGKYDSALETAKWNLLKDTGKLKECIEKWEILQIWDAHATWWINGNVFQWIVYKPTDKRWLDVNNNRNGEWWNAKRMSELLDWTYAWVFTNLYTSLLNMGRDFKITKGESDDFAIKTLNDCLSLLFLLVISVPLIAMTVVFIIRIFILWIAIIISPVIVLVKAFGSDLYDRLKKRVWSDGIGEYLEYFEVENLLKIIFFPAIMCFAISLAAVLVEIIKNINTEIIATEPLSILSWAITLNIAGFGVGVWKVVCSIICLAATWYLLRACIEFTKIWKEWWVVKWLKDLTTSALWSLPIIPVPVRNEEWKRTVGWAGINTVFWSKHNDGIITTLTNKAKTEFENQSNTALDNFFRDKEDPAAEVTTYMQNIQKNIPASNRQNAAINIGSWKKLKFSEMTQAQQEDVIEKINNLDDTTKDKFGTSSPKLTLENNTTYTYDTQAKEYKWPTNPTPPSTSQPPTTNTPTPQPTTNTPTPPSTT